MIRIGVIRERKKLPDERVPLIPRQCTYIEAHYPGIKIVVEPSPIRCYTDAEYQAEGIELNENLSDCDILLGVKEVPADSLVPDKTYFFFSHTKKKQPYNQGLMRALIEKRIRMIDYECLTHSDDQRILGFGLYAGICVLGFLYILKKLPETKGKSLEQIERELSTKSKWIEN